MDKNKLAKAVAETVKEIGFEAVFKSIMHGSKSRAIENLNRLSYKELDKLEDICYRLQMIIKEKRMRGDR